MGSEGLRARLGALFCAAVGDPSITIASAFEATVLLIGVGIIVWGIISAMQSAGME